jgi:DNA invertase Pin-like site-specific DNA recombinase
MITDKQIETMLKTVPNELYRDVAGALTGAKNGMSASETAKFYSITVPFVQECWNKYGLTTETASTSTGKRSDKNNAIKKFLESNIGKTIKPQDLVDASGISMPTFYNFYNANRGYFKKVKRGQFEIIDPNTEREKDK